jgi:4-hydroxy-tetrahydrodipicolinate synthase
MGIGRVFSPVLTPFGADLAPDAARLIAHCRWLLSQEVGLAVFGTTSEGNSLSVPEKISLLEALARADIDLRRAMPGTGACALADTVELTRRAVGFGCHGVLMLPPFYYKPVSDDGLYAYFSEVIQRVGDRRLRIYLYHIPPVSGVGLSLTLIERLRKDYPDSMAGMKDSGGDWNHTEAVLNAMAGSGFELYCGSEEILLASLQHGGAGCISATANVNPAAIVALCRQWRDADAPLRQQRLNALRAVFENRPMIPALKAAIAHFRDDAAWKSIRPPLLGLPAPATAELLQELHDLGFNMPAIGP